MTLALAYRHVVAEDARTRIERAVVMALQPLTRNLGGYLAAVEPYNGELSGAEAFDQLALRLRGRTPSVLVVVGAVDYEIRSTTSRRARARYDVELLVVSNHLRSHESRNTGDVTSIADATRDPGVFRILEDVRDLLWARELPVAGVGVPLPQSEDPIILTQELNAWRAVYQMDCRAEQRTPTERSEVPLESIAHRHNLIGDEPVNPVVEGELDAT